MLKIHRNKLHLNRSSHLLKILMLFQNFPSIFVQINAAFVCMYKTGFIWNIMMYVSIFSSEM